MATPLDKLSPETARHLRRLRKASLAVQGGSLRYCCGHVACMIAGTMGGKIVAGTVNGEPHYWNRLPCGTEVDLTSCQYGGDGFTPLAHAKIKRVRSKPKRIVPEFIFFAADVLRQLEQLGK